MFDKESHYRGVLGSAEEKLRNAQRALYEHTHRKKPCENCAEAEETGYGRAWHCDYYHTIQNRIEKYSQNVQHAKADLRRVQREEECKEK